MGDVFLSYAREDQPRVRELANCLQESGLSVFWDARIEPGRGFDRVIEDALRRAGCVVVLWTPASVESDWVRSEAMVGRERDILVPVLFEDSRPPIPFNRIHHLDLVGWGGDRDRLRTLVDAIHVVLGTPVEGRTVVPSAGAPPLASTMYVGGICYSIHKLFASLQLVPERAGLRLHYVPVVDGAERPGSPGYINLLLPLDVLGGLHATVRAFLYNVESLDENVVFKGRESAGEQDILVKLYRDKPRGPDGRLSGEETCWFRISSGPSEEENRRLKLGSRDLLSFELACTMVELLAASSGTHRPTPSSWPQPLDRSNEPAEGVGADLSTWDAADTADLILGIEEAADLQLDLAPGDVTSLRQVLDRAAVLVRANRQPDGVQRALERIGAVIRECGLTEGDLDKPLPATSTTPGPAPEAPPAD